MTSTLPARGRRTKRDQIFALMARGLDNGQIAERLGVARGTVANWRIVWVKMKEAA